MNIETVKTINDLRGKYLTNFYKWDGSGFWESNYDDSEYYVLECLDSSAWEDEYADEGYFEDIYDYVVYDDTEATVVQIRNLLREAMTCDLLPFTVPENVIEIMLDEAERIIRTPEFKDNGFGDLADIRNAGILIAFECFVCLKNDDTITQRVQGNIADNANNPYCW